MTINRLRQKYDREYKKGPAKLAPLYLTEEVWMNDKAPLDAMIDATILSLDQYARQWKSEGHDRITVCVDVLIGLLDIAISHRGISS